MKHNSKTAFTNIAVCVVALLSSLLLLGAISLFALDINTSDLEPLTIFAGLIEPILSAVAAVVLLILTALACVGKIHVSQTVPMIALALGLAAVAYGFVDLADDYSYSYMLPQFLGGALACIPPLVYFSQHSEPDISPRIAAVHICETLAIACAFLSLQAYATTSTFISLTLLAIIIALVVLIEYGHSHAQPAIYPHLLLAERVITVICGIFTIALLGASIYWILANRDSGGQIIAPLIFLALALPFFITAVICDAFGYAHHSHQITIATNVSQPPTFPSVSTPKMVEAQTASLTSTSVSAAVEPAMPSPSALEHKPNEQSGESTPTALQDSTRPEPLAAAGKDTAVKNNEKNIHRSQQILIISLVLVAGIVFGGGIGYGSHLLSSTLNSNHIIAEKHSQVTRLNQQVEDLSDQKKEAQDTITKASRIKKSISSLKNQQKDLQTKVDALNQTYDKQKGQPIQLPAGQFTVGKEVPAGRYIIKGTSNFATFTALGETDINTILGNEDGIGDGDYHGYLAKGETIDNSSPATLIPVE